MTERFLVLYMMESDLESLQESGSAQVFLRDPGPAPDGEIFLRNVRFSPCDNCNEHGIENREGPGIAAWGPCRRCRRALYLNRGDASG